MYAKASPEQAEMCALYSVLVDGLHGLGEWQEWATYSEHYGTYLRERQMVDEFSTAYKRGDIATLSNVRMELAAATSDTFLHEQLCRLELKLRRRLCLRTITFPAETWTVVFEYLHHRECHAPHEASRNFRNILAPILRHPNILTVVEVAITSSSFEFYGCTAIVRTVECGDKASGGPKSLFRAIDFVARLTSLHRVQVMNINADEYLSPALVSKFRRYFGSVNVDRLSVDRMDFTTSRLQCTNESWDDEPLTSDSLYDSDDDRDTLLHFIDSLKSIDEVCLEQRCKLSSGQVNDALMGGCRAKRIHHLDLRCAPSFGLTYEVTDAGLIEFCVGGEGDGRARYLSICCPSISDDFFLHLHKAHRNAEHQDPFVLRMELDPHEIETIQKLVQQVETSANLSPERDADQNGGAMRLTVEYGLPDTDDPPKPSRFVTIARS
ncbi:hypothetical protein AAVH_40811 [Aphelenchoides avenae]|nr:hypothetical protein AAVH_40811 [Aphelenchus avenae]